MPAKTATMWLAIGAVALLQLGVVAGMGFSLWMQAPAALQDELLRLAGRMPALFILGAVGLLVVPAVVIGLVFRGYVAPLRTLVDGLALIARTNPRHRLVAHGPPELRRVAEAVNAVADAYHRQQEELEARLAETGAVLEEERGALAALLAQVNQGIVVCTMEGRVLTYNARAQHMLEGPRRDTGAGAWIGVGQSIHDVLDDGLIRHALMTLVHGRHRGEEVRMAPFVATRAGGQVLNVHLVPIAGRDGRWHGYVLTIDDATERIARESRRVAAFRRLIEGQRAAVGGIRAGIEALLTYRDMEDERRLEFERMILAEAMRLRDNFEGLEDRIAREREARGGGYVLAAGDLLAGIERHVHDVLGVHLEVSVPVEPVRIKVESYAIARCFIFLIEQIRSACRGEALAITLHEGTSLCALDLQWSGAPLAAEALRAWGMRNVFTDTGGAPRSLFEVIEQHSGAIWSLPPGGVRERPCLRVLLPLADDAGAPEIALTDTGVPRRDTVFAVPLPGGRIADPASAPLRALRYTVVDTETTGLFPDRDDEIISVAAVRVVGGRILRRQIFDTLVNPQRPIPLESQEIHGITSDMVRGAPPIGEVLPRLARFVEDTVIIGHNIAFDLRFFALKAEATGTRFTNLVLDTFLLDRLVDPDADDRRLDSIAARLGVPVIGRHSALGDALTTAEVFLALIPRLAARGIVTLKDAVDACAPDLEARLRAAMA